MSWRSRKSLAWLAPLGWFLGALVVVVVSVVAMRNGASSRLADRDPALRAASALKEAD